MQREAGEKTSQIWLIGDSSPSRWQKHLDAPLDSRHPARHNIWTPILDGIQKHVFVDGGQRVDDSPLYVRNAVYDSGDKPRNNATGQWEHKLAAETDAFGQLLGEYSPRLVFTFGAFSFEFARRSLARDPGRSINYWTTEKLGVEFRRAIKEFNLLEVNAFPLLHVSIARGQFLKAHTDFTGEPDGNYFDSAAREIATLLLKHKDALNVWVEHQVATR